MRVTPDIARWRTREELRAAGLLVFVGLVAAWMGLSRLHYFQDADSLVPVLVSLQRWTPFFWGQDRFGTLVPLLALPFRHPLANLLVQGWLMTVAALLAPFLLARYVAKDAPYWFAAGALANLGFLLLVPLRYQFDWLVVQLYGLSLTLPLASLLLLERSSAIGTVGTVVLMLLAHWVNIAAFLIVLPLIVLRGRSLWRSLSVVGFGVAAGFLIMRRAHSLAPGTLAPQQPPILARSVQWPHAWRELLRAVQGQVISHHSWLELIISFAVISAAVMWVRKSREPVKAAATAGVVGLGYRLFVGALRWVELSNIYPPVTSTPAFCCLPWHWPS